jgi:GMP synthase (glutamine-hydrolysing)
MNTTQSLARGILILDYGSQYTLLIARRIRELGVYCEIWPCNDARLHQAVEHHVAGAGPLALGVILSGGPNSVHVEGAPSVRGELLALGIPILGICYGMQLLAQTLGGSVAPAAHGEYGRTAIVVEGASGLLAGLAEGGRLTTWMSHGDTVTTAPPGFEVVAHSVDGLLAVMQDPARSLYAVQFHPEVTHTEGGTTILSNFIFSICGALADWTMGSFLQLAVDDIRARVGEERVICGLSGGVDSSVVAALLARAIGRQTTCVFVDTGLLRHGEREQVEELFRGHFDVDLRVVDATARFLGALAGVEDPERKRKIIGEQFIRVFEEEARKVGEAKFLAQGTLYPDVIESVSIRGPSATIKSHHNVGGLPDDLDFELVEPLRELFKDEVRALGRELGLPHSLVGRHPFPGPGLAVRILGEVTPERVETVRAADHLFIQGLHDEGLYDQVWQAFAVLLPVRTVGVMGDQRTYDQVIALRAVTSTDGMTADRAHLPHDFLGRISDRIINKVDHVNRVVYDVSSKPPATIEWE